MIFNPLHYNLIEKYHKNPVKEEIVRYAKGRVLDLGCGDRPFHPFIKDQIDEYIAVDHPDTPHSKEHIDYFASAYELPFEEDYFDTVLLTQVIEHLEDPKAGLLEIHRVLKNKGVLILSWPFLYPIHEAPRDFFRYTKYGMDHLSEKSGFRIKKITPVSGFWITYFSFLSIYILRKSKLIYYFLFPLLFLFKYICILLEMIDKNENSKAAWTWNYYAILEKFDDGV
jgi:SAM-dependent methyltransferase